jgi:hypothetical protein
VNLEDDEQCLRGCTITFYHCFGNGSGYFFEHLN